MNSLLVAVGLMFAVFLSTSSLYAEEREPLEANFCVTDIRFNDDMPLLDSMEDGVDEWSYDGYVQDLHLFSARPHSGWTCKEKSIVQATLVGYQVTSASMGLLCSATGVGAISAPIFAAHGTVVGLVQGVIGVLPCEEAAALESDIKKEVCRQMRANGLNCVD